MNTAFETLPEGYFSFEDVQEYRKLANKVPKNGTICEIGVFKGRSLCSIADIILSNNITVYAVDTFKGTPGEHSEEEVRGMQQTFLDNLHKYGLEEHVIVICMDSISASKKISDKIIDLLFIDADHSKEAVISDIRNWLPKVKRFGIVAGHDLHFEGVEAALKELKMIYWLNPVPQKSSVWNINKKKLMKDNGEVVAYICTKDRYHNLYVAIMAVLGQTQKPEGLIIFDDSKHTFDLRTSSEWDALFYLLDHSGIIWHYIYTGGVGQVRNHNKAIDMCLSEFLWRIDDDTIPQNDVLKKLYSHISVDEEVGAVGGKILTHKIGFPVLKCSSYIADIHRMPNLQLATDAESVYKNVEHLHCSFIYKRDTGVRYNDKLSEVGHREETLFSYGLYKADYKLIVDLSAVTLHTKSPMGGIRSQEYNKDESMFMHDEDIFLSEIGEDIIKKKILAKETNLVILDNAIGDHYVFKQVMPNIIKARGRITLAVCYPEVFEEYIQPNEHVQIISIEDARSIVESMKMTMSAFNIYAYMQNNKWTKSLAEAYEALYL